jgi:hypothetical protein
VLDHYGRFQVTIGGGGKLSAVITLDSPAISVAPDRTASKPYAIEVEELEAGRSFRTNRIFVDGLAEAGAASIFALLNEGASLARAVSPVRVKHVRALWRYGADLQTWLGDSASSRYGDAAIHVGGNRDGSQRDEFEAFPLLHEYGHHLLEAVADPGVDAVGEHDFSSVHPKNPALAWSEGFANAFAAIVLGDPKLTLGCKPAMDVGAAPATPEPVTDRYAQYNETAIAGAVWHLVKYLGGADAGLRRFLKALHRYRRDGHPPRDLRDVRDSLIVGGLEGSNKRWEAIYHIFWYQRIAWSFWVRALLLKTPSGDFKLGAWLTIRGPYGCDGAHGDGQAGGGLPYTRSDDCFSADGWGGLPLSGWGGIGFPYLPGGGHRSGRFTVLLTFDCVDGRDRCPDAAGPFQLKFSNGALEWSAPSVSVRRGETIELGEIDARGDCQFRAGVDCSV